MGLKSREYKPSQDQLLSLLRLARSLGVVHHVDELIDLLVTECTGAVHADRCTIFLVDKEHRELWSKVAVGEKKRIRFPMDQGIAGETVAKGQVINVEDAYQYPGFNREIDKKTGYRTKTILAVPMANVQGEIVGCVQAINKVTGTFSSDDAAFLQLLANQAAIFLESAMIRERQKNMIQDLEVTKKALENKMKEQQLVYELETSLSATTSLSEAYTIVGSSICSYIETSGVLFVSLEGKNDPKAYFFEENELREMDLYGVMDRVRLRIKSEFTNKMVADIIGKDVGGHLGTHFHGNLELGDGQSSDIWGNLEIVNLPENFDDQNLSFLNIVAEMVSATIVRLRLQEKRENSQRLATIGQLSSTIVHDFRSPMTSIRGFAELIRRNEKMEPDRRIKLCGIIMSQVDRCTVMIEELLAFARGHHSFNFKVCNVGELFEEILMLLAVEAERKGVTLEHSIGYTGDVELDKDKIMRVVFNLTNNALEILEQEQKLIISVDRNQESLLEIRVQDTGPGIPKELRKTLFDAFVTKGKAGGTGLGLHISKEIVEGHQGTLTLEEHYRDGAGFLIKIPSTQAMPQSA